MLKYAIRYKFSLLLAVIIVLLSLLPSSSLPDSSLFSIPFLDKIVHMGMYGLLTLVILLEIRCADCFPKHLFVGALVFFMGLLIEILQSTVIPTRTAEWLDLLANSLGLLGAYVFYRILLPKRIKSGSVRSRS
jgi:VanZ family protein